MATKKFTPSLSTGAMPPTSSTRSSSRATRTLRKQQPRMTWEIARTTRYCLDGISTSQASSCDAQQLLLPFMEAAELAETNRMRSLLGLAPLLASERAVITAQGAAVINEMELGQDAYSDPAEEDIEEQA